jgi:hypothetical protein
LTLRSASIACFAAFAALAGCGLDTVGVPGRGTSTDSTEPDPGGSGSGSATGPNGPSAPVAPPGDPSSIPICQNSALAFDGVDDLATAPDDLPALDLDGDFTVEAWIKPSASAVTAGEMHIVSHHDPADGGWELRIKDGRINVVVWGEEFLASTGYTAGYAGSAYVAPDTWAHVAGVLHSDTLYVFYDGVLRDTRDLPITFSRGAYRGPLTLGRAASVDDYHYQGALDDVRISKVARYQATFPRPTSAFVADDDTVALYGFDEAAGTMLVDASGHGHNGSLPVGPSAPARGSAPCVAER